MLVNHSQYAEGDISDPMNKLQRNCKKSAKKMASGGVKIFEISAFLAENCKSAILQRGWDEYCNPWHDPHRLKRNLSVTWADIRKEHYVRRNNGINRNSEIKRGNHR